MYVVHNTTNKLVTLSDLKAEIGPRKILDLEKIAHRDQIERSYDLKVALTKKYLRLIKHSVITVHQVPKQKNPTPEIIHHVEKFDDEKLLSLIKETISEEIQKQKSEDIGSTLKHAISSGVKDLQESIRNQINNIKISPDSHVETEVIIDPEKLAELQQKPISKITESIETSGSSKGKKINVINSNVKNLADEL